MSALSSTLSTPPAPDINALGAQGQPGGSSQTAGPSQQPQTPPAPPTHQQVVGAMRHFDAIEKELSALLSDPDVGKADLKSKIIDGTTKLVANRILSPSQAVMQLGTVPERPFDQKQWLQTHLAQTVQAATMILAHHAVGAQQAEASGQPMDTSPPSPDGHIDAMAGLAQNYRGTPNA